MPNSTNTSDSITQILKFSCIGSKYYWRLAIIFRQSPFLLPRSCGSNTFVTEHEMPLFLCDTFYISQQRIFRRSQVHPTFQLKSSLSNHPSTWSIMIMMMMNDNHTHDSVYNGTFVSIRRSFPLFGSRCMFVNVFTSSPVLSFGVDRGPGLGGHAVLGHTGLGPILESGHASTRLVMNTAPTGRGAGS